MAAPLRRLRRDQRALAEQLFEDVDRDSEVFPTCGAAITAAGETLLERAQEAGVVRPATNFLDVARMVGGISAIRTADPEQIPRILTLALDGLRPR